MAHAAMRQSTDDRIVRPRFLASLYNPIATSNISVDKGLSTKTAVRNVDSID
jgi:hypothetical protein